MWALSPWRSGPLPQCLPRACLANGWRSASASRRSQVAASTWPIGLVRSCMAPFGQAHIKDYLRCAKHEKYGDMKSLGAFALQTLRAVRANQGLLLAGAVAYYALLSLMPLLLLTLIALSHVIDRALLLDTVERYLARL